MFLLEHLVVRQQRVRDFAAALSDPRVCASNSAFTANLVLVFKRMLLAVTGALSHRPSELPEMNENTPERQLQKFVGIVKKVAPWWQWGAPDELLSADDVPADAKCTFNGKRDEYPRQPWYFCYTCGLLDHKGMCSTCVVTCHRNHDTFNKVSGFDCDCGADGFNDGSKHSCTCRHARTEEENKRIATLGLPQASSSAAAQQAQQAQQNVVAPQTTNVT